VWRSIRSAHEGKEGEKLGGTNEDDICVDGNESRPQSTVFSRSFWRKNYSQLAAVLKAGEMMREAI